MKYVLGIWLYHESLRIYETINLNNEMKKIQKQLNYT